MMKLATIMLVVSLFFSSNKDLSRLRCDVAFDGIDIKTKLYKKEIKPHLLFQFTPRELKNDLQQENLLTAQAQLIKIENLTYLNLNIEVYSQRAVKEYGSIDLGSKLKIKTINGKSVDLNCRAGSTGTKVPFENTYVYAISYELANSDMKALKKSEIDLIGLQWSSGFEEYIIYELDFFINQLECLNQ